MGYLHIQNLYRDQTILLFKECYALEKIHGTSAHLSWDASRRNGVSFDSDGLVFSEPAPLVFFAGGAKHETFVGSFDAQKLSEAFRALGHEKVVVFGEAYGGKVQGNSWRYGKVMKFVAFDVKIGDVWLKVPDAEDVVQKLGLEFVHYVRVPATVEALDAERDAPSVQAVRNGIVEPQPREGVVCRPLREMGIGTGRVICKHKRDEERETRTPRAVVDPEKQKVLDDAESIAFEWVTDRRLDHVLDKLPPPRYAMEKIREVIGAMLEDVLREGEGEFVDTPEARKAIQTRAARMYKARTMQIRESE